MKRLVTCVLLVGCGGDEGGHGSIAIDDISVELSTAACGVQFGCCTAPEIMQKYMGITFEGQPIDTEQRCIDYANAVYSTFGVLRYKDSIAKGRASYDGTAAADCIAALEDLTCQEYSTGDTTNLAAACRPYILPEVADGGACTQDYECTSGNCIGEDVPLEGPATDGACGPLPGPGEPCDDNCPDGHVCSFDQTAGDNICQATKLNGSACELDRECTSENCDEATDTCTDEPLICDGL